VAWPNFVIGIAPYVVALASVIAAAFWGRQVLAAKNAQLAAKDEQLKTAKLMAPKRVVKNMQALHTYYQAGAKLTATQLKDLRSQLAAAGAENQGLQDEINLLRGRLTIFEFGSASTATALLTTSDLSAASLEALMETITHSYEPTDVLDEVGVDEDGLPMYRVGDTIMTTRQAQEYLVEQGLADPETLKDD
jgi:hypothetical protein